MPEDNSLVKNAGEIITLIREFIDVLREKPYSSASREEMERDCIGSLPQPEIIKCRRKTRQYFFTASFEYSRTVFKFSKDILDVEVTLHWSFDNCHIYDLYLTHTKLAGSDDWTYDVRLKVAPLQEKKKSVCKCCPVGCDCVFVRIELEATCSARLWPDPSSTRILFQGKIYGDGGIINQ